MGLAREGRLEKRWRDVEREVAKVAKSLVWRRR
jgi:hypothetical protein